MKDRDVRIPKERSQTPPRGAPLVAIDDEYTDQYDGEELARMRAKRPTMERFRKLEEKQDKFEAKHDQLDAKVDDMHGDVREMRGELKAALAVIVPAHREAHATERHKVDSRTKVIIAVVGAVSAAVGILATTMAGCS